MRSKCRSFLYTAGFLALSQGSLFAASTCFASFLVLPAQAKGAAENTGTNNNAATTVDEESDTSKCNGPTGGSSGASSSGAPTHRRSSYSGEGALGRMALDLSNLNLSDDQKSKIATIRGRNATHAKELRQSISLKACEYRNMLFSVSSTNEQIIAKHDEIRSIKEELENLRLNDLLAIRAVLNADQRKKLAETKPFERRPGQHGPGGPAGPDNDSERERPEHGVSTAANSATLVKAK